MHTDQKDADYSNQFVNQYKPGRIAWKCNKCQKQIWLEPQIYEKAYKDVGVCLDCRNK